MKHHPLSRLRRDRSFLNAGRRFIGTSRLRGHLISTALLLAFEKRNFLAIDNKERT